MSLIEWKSKLFFRSFVIAMALTTTLLSAFAAFGGLVAGAACCQAVLRRQDGKAPIFSSLPLGLCLITTSYVTMITYIWLHVTYLYDIYLHNISYIYIITLTRYIYVSLLQVGMAQRVAAASVAMSAISLGVLGLLWCFLSPPPFSVEVDGPPSYHRNDPERSIYLGRELSDMWRHLKT